VRNKGRNRREMIRAFFAEGNLDALCDELLSDTLDEEVRDSIGRIHPSFMGGEYLPNLKQRPQSAPINSGAAMDHRLSPWLAPKPGALRRFAQSNEEDDHAPPNKADTW
jgi:hypothetical protein